ncbi:MAG: DEAD/DEAH box helicase [Bacteroidetes bacterium]|nr:DEAD/DEAH box helicase [Bacteroidota bacterium]
MVQTRRGITKKFASSRKLLEFFESSTDLEGIFYTGYPILFSTVESKTVDALWISQQHGIVVFDLSEGGPVTEAGLIETQDDLELRIKNLLSQYQDLRKRKDLLVDVRVVSYCPNSPKAATGEAQCFFNNEDLKAFIDSLPKWSNVALYEKTLSVLQSVTRLRGDSKRAYVKKSDSKGSRLKILEGTIASLDNDQEKAIIEYFEGVQRIRGLAGSGKTIILALKAAYLHAQEENWKIAVTFNTRSLKNQFRELIERFVVEKKGSLPNWENIKILHAWGNPSTEGIYYNFCKDQGIEYLDFRGARRLKQFLGEPNSPEFEVICRKAIQEVPASKILPKYDLILVDEAQDVSEHFLKMCYSLLPNPKRLIYAYDELQKLYEGSPLPNPKDIFGIDEYDDVILKTCYRNSKSILTSAHSLGFGIYREKPEDDRLVQFFDDPKLWSDVGYEVKEGAMTAGSNVTLARTEKSSPPYLERNLNNDIDDIIQFRQFETKNDQAKYIAHEIKKNLDDDELLHKDIIIINPEALTTKDEVGIARVFLQKLGITSHIAGNFNKDVFFQDNSIGFTGINRAKGNEVPMVYIINAEYCFEGPELKKKRNILFTAMTRSKAWLRVCGVGDSMTGLIDEFQKVKENNFSMAFKYPTEEQINKMNLINRDMSASERRTINTASSTVSDLKNILESIKEGKTFLEDYTEEVQEILRQLLPK